MGIDQRFLRQEHRINGMIAAVSDTEPLALIMLDRHLGNFLVASPVLCALAARHPRNLAVIHTPHLALAKRIPGFPQQVLTLGQEGGHLRGLWAFAGLLRRLRAARCGTLVEFGGSGSGATLGALSGIPRRICRDSAPRASRYTDRIPKPDGDGHRIRIYGALGGAAVPGLEWEHPRLQPTPEDRARAESILQARDSISGAPLVCLHVAGGKSYKHWPLDRYAALSDALYARGMQPALIGAAPDREAADTVLQTTRRKPLDLVGAMGLGPLIAVFERSAFFLGNDSGPMHMAAATGTPIVALFGPTDPARWGPLTDRVCIVRGTEPIPASEGKKTFADGRRMDSITLDSVLEAVAAMQGDMGGEEKGAETHGTP